MRKHPISCCSAGCFVEKTNNSQEGNVKKIKHKTVSKVLKRTRDKAISVLDKARRGLISMKPDLRLPIVL